MAEMTSKPNLCSDYPSDWKQFFVGDLVSITTGSRNTQDNNPKALFPFFVRSKKVERIDGYSFDKEAVLTAGDGVGTGKIFHYINGKFDAHQRVYVLSNFVDELHGKYFYWQFSNLFFDRIMSMTAKSSVDSVRKEMISRMSFPLPCIKEQQLIAEALSDADALIASLKKLIEKKESILASIKKNYFEVRCNNSEMVLLGENATFSKGRHLAKSQLSDSGKLPCVHYGELFTKYNAQILEIFSYTNLDQDTVLSKGGEVLMPTSDVTPSGLAKASYLRKPNVVIGGDILIIQPNEERLYGGFLSEVIRYLESQILSLVSGSTVYHIYAQDMAKFAFQLPNEVEEQKQIVETISDFRNEIAALNEELTKAKKVKIGMMQELLKGRTRLI